MADGNVSSYRKGYSPRLFISLQEIDSPILESFIREIRFQGKLRFAKAAKITHQNQYSVGITSRKLCESLAKLNCVPKKSLILKFPPIGSIPEHLMNHFVRGYFDGDGCITYTKRRSKLDSSKLNKRFAYRADIAGTRNFCEGVASVLPKEITYKIVQQGNISRIHFLRNENVKKLGEWIYKDATLFLTRKKEKFIHLNSYKFITTSKYAHVHYRTGDLKRHNLIKKWMATKKVDGKTKFVGVYLTEFEAYLGVCTFEEKQGLKFSNDPTEYYNSLDTSLSNKS